MKADLIDDLRMAVQKGIDQGTTLEEFRRDFEAIVAHHGWTGWTGEGTAAGRAWRTRVIYETNLRTSYAAGRHAQLKAAGFPYLRYKHNDNVMVPRPHHLALDGKIYRADDPFWNRAFPPSGFGCQCWVEGVSEREMKRLGKDGPDTPPEGWAADEGWNYAPGASVADDINRLLEAKLAKLPTQLGRDLAAAVAAQAAAVPPKAVDGTPRQPIQQGEAILGDMPIDAYTVAQVPGRPHHGWLKQQRKLPTLKLLKAIRSLRKQIALHEAWIASPYEKFPADNADPDEVDYHQKYKWPADIARQRQLIQILEGVIRERNDTA